MNTLQEAMLHFRRRHNNIKFLVFSDDPEWCKRQSLFEADDVLIMGRDIENKKSVKGNALFGYLLNIIYFSLRSTLIHLSKRTKPLLKLFAY